jgi:hypothetical protein
MLQRSTGSCILSSKGVLDVLSYVAEVYLCSRGVLEILSCIPKVYRGFYPAF